MIHLGRFSPAPQRLQILVALAFTFLIAGITGKAAESEPFAKEIQAFEESAKTNPPPQNAILFLGSSSIRLWKSLSKDFPDAKTINHGFGGSQIEDSIRYADRIAIPLHPVKIFFYAGVNDINAGKSPATVFGNFKTFSKQIHDALPKTKIYFISLAGNPARWAQVEKVKEANRLVREFCEDNGSYLRFVDVFPAMMGPDGKPLPDIFIQDRLHMNAKGYAIWTKIMKPLVAE